jgi:phospholipid/cholesterol/gamma-HCH transport system permease protein
MIVRSVEAVGRLAMGPVVELGRVASVLGRGALGLLMPPWRPRAIVRQMEFVGVQSIGIVALAGFFVGGVFALQSYTLLKLVGAETLVGSTVALAVCLELGPVLTALLVTGRAGSAMAAEIGTMRVTEQIDALEAMAVDPMNYLVAPRIVAATIMVPVLTVVFDVVAIFGSYLVGVDMLRIAEGPYLYRIEWYLDADDILEGLLKAAVFGFILALVGCSKGYHTRGGAEGVGRATTRAVVLASVAILISDFFLTKALM